MDDDLEPIGTDTAADRRPSAGQDREFIFANLRRNYFAHFAHGMLGMTGFRLVNAPTLVPTYLFLLTGSTAAVGVAQALQQAGSIISPLRSASAIEDKPYLLPYARRTGILMRVPLAIVALAGWFMGGWPLAAITIAALFLLGYFGGAQRVAFQVLMSKVIPLEKRGRLQGYRNLVGGGIAALLSWWAGAALIENNVLGNGYATTFAISFVLTSLGLTVLTLVLREPAGTLLRPTVSLRERMRDMPVLLQDRAYRNFLIAQLVAMAGRTAIPFCILYAGTKFEVDGSTLGLLSLAFLGMDTLSNLVWGALGDRFGFRLVFLLALALWALGYAQMLLAQDRTGFLIAFGLLGAAVSGYMLSAQTLVLEFGSSEDIPMRLALSTTVETSIAAIGPLIGGSVAHYVGFPPLLIFSLGALIAATAIVVLGVRDPRHAAQPVHREGNP
jgi:MFS family permease